MSSNIKLITHNCKKFTTEILWIDEQFNLNCIWNIPLTIESALVFWCLHCVFCFILKNQWYEGLACISTQALLQFLPQMLRFVSENKMFWRSWLQPFSLLCADPEFCRLLLGHNLVGKSSSITVNFPKNESVLLLKFVYRNVVAFLSKIN